WLSLSRGSDSALCRNGSCFSSKAAVGTRCPARRCLRMMRSAELQSNRSPLNLAGSSRPLAQRGPCQQSHCVRLVVIFGLILALASAVATNLGFLFKQRGAVVAPPIEVPHLLRSAVGLFRSRWFLIGWIVAVVAWGLHVGALSLAPLSIVQ